MLRSGGIRSVQHSRPRHKAPAFAAMLLEQSHARDHHATVCRFAHIVDGEQGDLDGGQRFHFNTGGAHSFCRNPADNVRRLMYGGAYTFQLHCEVRQGQGMAQRNQGASLFGTLNAGNAGNAQHVALFGRSALDQGQGGGLHVNTAFGNRDAMTGVFGGDVHHVGLALLIEVGERAHNADFT